MRMRNQYLRRAFFSVFLTGSVLGLSACDPAATSVNGSVGVGVYYDSMLWNDYYYGRPVPPNHRPINPPGARPPIGTLPPGGRPPTARPPIARPPVARPPIHRPMGGGGRFR